MATCVALEGRFGWVGKSASETTERTANWRQDLNGWKQRNKDPTRAEGLPGFGTGI